MTGDYVDQYTQTNLISRKQNFSAGNSVGSINQRVNQYNQQLDNSDQDKFIKSGFNSMDEFLNNTNNVNKDIQKVKKVYSEGNQLIQQVNKFDNFVKNPDNTVIAGVIGSIPGVRRLLQIEDNSQDGNWVKTAGLGTLALINLKEDFRDILTLLGRTSKVEDGYKSVFKFFAGTPIEPLLLKSELGKHIFYNLDTTLFQTKLVNDLLNKIGIKWKIQSIKKEISFPFCKTPEIIKRRYIKFEGPLMGRIFGYTLGRITKLGLVFAGLLELPKIIKSIKNDKDYKQIARSTVNVLSYTVLGAFTSAVLSMVAGSAGSVLGLGFGIYLGNQLSKYINSKF